MAADDSAEFPDSTKLTRTKRQWAREGRFLTGRVARPDSERLPPGQHLVRDWPVLDLGEQPEIALDKWELVVDGAVEHPVRLDWAQFHDQPQSQKTSDIHCVTTWSRYDNRWGGVATQDILDRVMPKADAHFVILHSYDRYTTNITLEDFASEDAIVAHSWEGQPLSREHGGPVRLIVPHLYLWKSAKWLKRIEFASRDAPGFWEVNGYHNRADPWKEQRYSDD
ncbi:sulfite oxidase-like oxidoreductase [Hyphomicrobium sp.]|uniref:sulfite oxidase-like oxidoreductase n=1 Tax=Hyphomicrobium sp. TaxID=82 RepID=UPI000FB0795C|nr:sulfite oxidase-like oxidoreductase [Hyphomicrobium sp.]RUP00431.1 MAG: sulfite oxidase-like oxidoreductase [Hyphomicrobium sp.]